jgi:hypothetical protein
MSITIISLLVAGCIFAGGLAGLNLNRLLPPDHQSKETQDVVRLGIGMLSVLASLVLGLLIATAKTSYDSADHAIRSYAAELALLNETLRDYGGDDRCPSSIGFRPRIASRTCSSSGSEASSANPAGRAPSVGQPACNICSV